MSNIRGGGNMHKKWNRKKRKSLKRNRGILILSSHATPTANANKNRDSTFEIKVLCAKSPKREKSLVE